MRLAAAFLSLALLAGCGFKPMYAPAAAGGGGAAIGDVSVAEVPGKAGHAFRTELVRLLSAEAPSSRRLEVSLTESVAGLGLRVDESASRADLILNSSYTLFDADGKELTKGRVSATASYDIPIAAYGAAAAQDDARERAGVLLAQRLRTDLALRLARLARDPPAPTQQVLPPPAQ